MVVNCPRQFTTMLSQKVEYVNPEINKICTKSIPREIPSSNDLLESIVSLIRFIIAQITNNITNDKAKIKFYDCFYKV